MNEQELQRYEAELRGASPALLPDHFMARLQKAKPSMEPAQPALYRPAAKKPWWPGVLRWLAPAAAMAALGLLAFRENFASEDGAKKKPLAIAPGFKADNVQVEEDLVSSFDVVATLPGGQPVRFRCRKWRDQLVATDKSHGVKIEQSNPRVEVVPVKFETY
jgi:hypothetical protein